MTRETRKAAEEYFRDRKARSFLSALMVVGIAALACAVVILFMQDESRKDQIGALDAGIEQINSSLKQVCRAAEPEKNALPQPVREDCFRAERDEKPPVVETVPAVAPEIDDATLYAAVRTVVSEVIAADPPKDGEAPSPEAILARVREVYLANKPADGKTPTDTELLSLIRRVYAESPPRDGVDGRDATQAMADAAIEKYCARPEKPCVGPPGIPGEAGTQGVQGDPGPYPISSVFERREGSCVYVTRYNNGTETVAPVNGGPQAEVSLCGPAESDPEPSDPPLPIPTG